MRAVEVRGDIDVSRVDAGVENPDACPLPLLTAYEPAGVAWMTCMPHWQTWSGSGPATPGGGLKNAAHPAVAWPGVSCVLWSVRATPFGFQPA